MSLGLGLKAQAKFLARIKYSLGLRFDKPKFQKRGSSLSKKLGLEASFMDILTSSGLSRLKTSSSCSKNLGSFHLLKNSADHFELFFKWRRDFLSLQSRQDDSRRRGRPGDQQERSDKNVSGCFDALIKSCGAMNFIFRRKILNIHAEYR